MEKSVINEDFRKNFEKYYTDIILPALIKQNAIRKKYLSIFICIYLFAIVWMGYALTHLDGLFNNNQLFNLLSIGVIIFTIFPMLSYYRKGKENILPLLCNYFGKFEYGYQQSFSETILSQSQIMSPYNQIKFDDCFLGEFSDVPISIAEYRLYETQNYLDNNTNKIKNIKKTSGIVFYAKMNKNFQGQTIIVKDKGIFNSLTHYKNMQRVKLESVDFEKKFEVYSNNQIEARYILTSVLIDNILILKRHFDRIKLSFFNQYVLINIETNKNLFECNSFFRSVVNKKRIEKNFHELESLFAIVEILKLNQKIMF